MTEDPKPERRKRLKDRIARTAPDIARTLGGPLAGAAVGVLARILLGADSADDDDLIEAFDRASPEQIEALRRADHDFRLAFEKLRLDEARIAAADRADARARQTALADKTPTALGALIIAGFFIVLGAMVTHRLPEGAETEFSIMLGALATMTAAVVNYFFGSSAGSREKTWLISGATETRKEAPKS